MKLFITVMVSFLAVALLGPLPLAALSGVAAAIYGAWWTWRAIYLGEEPPA